MRYPILLLLLVSQFAVAEVYRSVSGNGEVTFSDVPSQGSTAVRLPELTTYSAPRVTAPAEPATAQKAGADAVSYDSLSIDSPENQAALWDNEGRISIAVSLLPALDTEAGHRIQFYHDGVAYGEPELSMATTFSGLERGDHVLSAAVVDASGAPLITAKPVTVHLHKASIFYPSSPLNPANQSKGSSSK